MALLAIQDVVVRFGGVVALDPIEAMQIIRFDGKSWRLRGDLVEAKAG